MISNSYVDKRLFDVGQIKGICPCVLVVGLGLEKFTYQWFRILEMVMVQILTSGQLLYICHKKKKTNKDIRTKEMENQSFKTKYHTSN
jgi:undecaprenyl pyrophosphate phosphatase UppP